MDTKALSVAFVSVWALRGQRALPFSCVNFGVLIAQEDMNLIISFPKFGSFQHVGGARSWCCMRTMEIIWRKLLLQDGKGMCLHQVGCPGCKRSLCFCLIASKRGWSDLGTWRPLTLPSVSSVSGVTISCYHTPFLVKESFVVGKLFGFREHDKPLQKKNCAK